MKRIVLLIAISGIMGVLNCSNESSPLMQNTDMVVIRAYVYANEPVYDVQITSTLPLGSEDESAPPINDAQVTIIKNGNRYALGLSPGDSGYYHYGGNDLSIETGDRLMIEVYYFDKLAAGETVVPPPPTGVSLSREDLVVPILSGWGAMWGGGATIDTTKIQITISWENNDASLYYVALENVESNPQPIESDLPFFGNRRFISQPTSGNNYTIRFNRITHLGRHCAKVYQINQEYADLYLSRSQNSRDLNEPLTNINNGLGVFSAFNSDSVFFYAVRE